MIPALTEKTSKSTSKSITWTNRCSSFRDVEVAAKVAESIPIIVVTPKPRKELPIGLRESAKSEIDRALCLVNVIESGDNIATPPGCVDTRIKSRVI